MHRRKALFQSHCKQTDTMCRQTNKIPSVIWIPLQLETSLKEGEHAKRPSMCDRTNEIDSSGRWSSGGVRRSQVDATHVASAKLHGCTGIFGGSIGEQTILMPSGLPFNRLPWSRCEFVIVKARQANLRQCVICIPKATLLLPPCLVASMFPSDVCGRPGQT